MTVSLRKVEPFSRLAIEKLESSGLSEAEARRLGMYSIPNAALLDPQFKPAPALVIPYLTIAGQTHKPRPHDAPFYRLRYLGEGHTFAEIGDKKPTRYVQPKGTMVSAYFPHGFVDWEAISKNTDEPIFITEGEFKAAKATSEGFFTIGLGGVHSYMAAKDGVFFLPELEAFRWFRRTVRICFDSDYSINSNICKAINGLADELCRRGALVCLMSLPDVYDDGRKTGLDDYLVEKGGDALAELVQTETTPLTMVRRLLAMNEEVCYVANPGIVVDQSSDTKYKPDAFVKHSHWSTLAVPELKVSPTGGISTIRGEAASQWIKWPLRCAVASITYAPGQPRFPQRNGQSYYNDWEGWGCEPKRGDIKPWKDLLSFLFAGMDKGFTEWFEDWCAYPVQNPGKKMFSAVVVHGLATGTGKTLVGYTLGKIYGANFTKLENKHFKNDFNSWARNRQFILGDEITGSDKRSEADALKTLITQEEISVNIKGVPQYTIPDCINYYFTSQHADAFFLEDKDRRYAIAEVQAEEPLPDEFYRTYEAWKEGDGPAALMHYLLQRDISKFNPKAPAFKTAARERMIMHGKSDVGSWCHQLKTDPDYILKVGQMRHQKDLFTNGDLLSIYQASHPNDKKLTATGLGRALAAAGFKWAHDGKSIRNGEKVDRYWITRNIDKWKRENKIKLITDNIKLSPAK